VSECCSSIWLDLGPDKQALRDQYVLVEGFFDARRKGHMGMVSGSLTSVTRIERWPSQQEFVDRLNR